MRRSATASEPAFEPRWFGSKEMWLLVVILVVAYLSSADLLR